MCTNGDADCCGAYVAYWHLADITTAPAKTLGLPVDIEMPKEIMELMTLYPQPVRMQGGGVEYLPEPRQKHSSRPR
jgi:hypothetical protein